jgi:hypothetical protein
LPPSTTDRKSPQAGFSMRTEATLPLAEAAVLGDEFRALPGVAASA